MKKNEHMKTICMALALTLVAWFSPEIADAANFSAIDKKGTDTTDFLTGTVAIIVITVALIINILGGMFFQMDKKQMVNIGAGAIAISFVGELVAWLLAK